MEKRIMLVYLKKVSFWREVWRRGLTREDLIRKLNLTSDWISASKKPSAVYVPPQMRRRMMAALGVTFDVIFFQIPFDSKRILRAAALRKVGLAASHHANVRGKMALPAVTNEDGANHA